MKSLIYDIEDDKFIKIVKDAKSYSEILPACGLSDRGANRKTIVRRIKSLNISCEHLKSNLGRTFQHRQWTLDEANREIFTVGSGAGTTILKKLILRFNLIPHKCKCGITDSWESSPISLQLEHKNGIHDDNRIDNLTFLCPNCHSQTSTYAGKSGRKGLHKKYSETFNNETFREDCKNLTAKKVKEKYSITQSTLNTVCRLFEIISPKQQRNQKVKWTEDLLKKLSVDVNHTSLRQLGKVYDVSANRLKDVCKEHQIFIPKIKKHCSLI